MRADACRTTFGNYLNCMRCASRLQDALTHVVIITRLHQFQFHWFIRQVALARRQRNDHTVFESLPPTSTTPALNLHTVPLMLNVKQGSCEYQFFKFFGMAQQGNEPRFTDCKEDALTITPSLLPLHYHCSINCCKTRKPQCTNIDKQKNNRPEQQALVLIGSKFC